MKKNGIPATGVGKRLAKQADARLRKECIELTDDFQMNSNIFQMSSYIRLFLASIYAIAARKILRGL